MSQAALSTSIGTSVRAIKAYEAGAYAPGAEPLRRIARALKFPERFFFGDDIGDLRPQATSFRSISKLTARQRNAALGSAAVAIAFNQVIECLYALPEAAFPKLRSHVTPEEAAETVRKHWDLGEKPVENVVQLLESRGVRVFSLPSDAVEADTFSLWCQDRPLMFLNTLRTAHELRLDAVHELGHLLLHRHKAPASPEAQHAAGDFACVFLMPAGPIRAGAPRAATLSEVMLLSDAWRVPPDAIVRRLLKLDLLSDWRYRALCNEIPKQGGDHGEGPARESSQLLRKVFAALRARGITKHKMASTVHIYPKDLGELVFGLALQPSHASSSAFEDLRPRLTVVSAER